MQNTQANDYYEDMEAQQAAQELFQGNDMSKVVKAFTEEDKIPEDVRKHKVYNTFWALMTKTAKLTFLERGDIYEFESRFNVAMHKYKMSMPVYEFSFNELQLLDQLKINFLLTLRRNVGVNKNIMNERTLLASVIQHRVRTNTEGVNMPQAGGLKGWFQRKF